MLATRLHGASGSYSGLTIVLQIHTYPHSVLAPKQSSTDGIAGSISNSILAPFITKLFGTSNVVSTHQPQSCVAGSGDVPGTVQLNVAQFAHAGLASNICGNVPHPSGRVSPPLLIYAVYSTAVGGAHVNIIGNSSPLPQSLNTLA